MRSLKFKVIGYKLKGLKFSFALLLCILVNGLFAGTPVENAADAYSKQEYKKAIEIYESIVAGGEASAPLYYNLGNAYYKDNQLGKAIYYYELAKKINPNDEDIKNNLQLANSKLIDKIETKENFFAGAIKSGLYTLLSTNGWARLNIVSLVFALGSFFVFIISENLLLKRSGFLLGALFTVTFLVSFGIGYASLRNLNKKSQAVVTAQVVQVMNAPTTHAKPKFSLHEGTKLNVLSTNDEWTSVQLANGNEGWIKTQQLGLF
ncbi:MAG: tetratricopeptide repeat protein [Bacteroidia bacterium]